jgi:Ser/Thr protein kinase RdoA (MazF antagonist)
VSDESEPEEPLAGGNHSTVSRVGDTVRRTAGPWTPTIHALLRHLRTAGVTEVPEPFGIDDQGREILSFRPGEVGNHPLPSWLWTEEILVQAGTLLRRVHDASRGFDPAGAVWQLPGHEPAEVICLNDVAPYNMVLESGRIVGLVDLDTASPGPRIWDLAYLAYRLVPFVGDAAVDLSWPQRSTRLRRLIEAYGGGFTDAEVYAVMAQRLIELAVFTDGRAEQTGRPDFVEHAALYRRDAAALRARAKTSAAEQARSSGHRPSRSL